MFVLLRETLDKTKSITLVPPLQIHESVLQQIFLLSRREESIDSSLLQPPPSSLPLLFPPIRLRHQYCTASTSTSRIPPLPLQIPTFVNSWPLNRHHFPHISENSIFNPASPAHYRQDHLLTKTTFPEFFIFNLRYSVAILVLWISRAGRIDFRPLPASQTICLQKTDWVGG